MAVYSSAGSTVAITAAKPATFDAAGYGALAFTTIGEITNAGEFGREWEKIEHKPLAMRGTVKAKGGYDAGAIALTIGLDEKDAGQIMLEAAANSDATYFFCITRLTGDKYYVPALAMNFKRNVGERGQITSLSVSLEINTTNGTDIVAVKAA